MRKTTTPALRTASTATTPGTRDASTLEQIRRQRLIKFTQQNERLKIELERIKQTHVSLDEITRDILNANTRVKAKLDALPSRLAVQIAGSTPGEAEHLMRAAIREALMELAYEREHATAKQKRTVKKETEA